MRHRNLGERKKKMAKERKKLGEREDKQLVLIIMMWQQEVGTP